MTYALVISRYSMRIVLMLSDLNGLNLKCADIKNESINTNLKYRVYFRYEQEFVVHKSNMVVVVRPLYGLKGAGYAWALALR